MPDTESSMTEARDRSRNRGRFTEKLTAMGWTMPKLVSATGKFGDASIFAVFAIFGIVCELVIHTLTRDAILIIATPVLILFLYLGFTLAYRRLRLRFDQLGDNCYYLGFLFTLTALAIALYNFREAGVNVSAIVSNFGVALASTIVGIGLRIFLVQMREDPVEVEEQSRAELAKAAADLKSQLSLAAGDMKSFHGLLQQAVGEINEKSKEAILNATEELSVTAMNINGEITGRNERLGERFDHLDNLAQRSIVSFEALVGSMERVQPPGELIHEIFAKTISEMENFRQESEKTHQITQRQRAETKSAVTSATNAISLVSEDLLKLTGEESPLSRILENLQQATNGLESVGKDIRSVSLNLADEITARKDKLDEFNSVTSESVSLIRGHNTALGEALEQNRKMLLEVEKNLADMARALVKAVG